MKNLDVETIVWTLVPIALIAYGVAIIYWTIT